MSPIDSIESTPSEEPAPTTPAVPVAIQRLLDEVRAERHTPSGAFDRAHNRHNRSMG
jgi:hypothetical protein